MVPISYFRVSSRSQRERLNRILGFRKPICRPKLRLTLESLESRRVLATFQVTSALDTINSSDGAITLREAISSANSTFGSDTITFASAINGMSINRDLLQGELEITDSVTIAGNGETNTIVNAGNRGRVFNVTSGNVTFSGMTISGGSTSLGGGGINFDAKRRRNSTDPTDLFYAHVGGMDVFARALIVADAVLQKSDYKQVRKNRYASFDTGTGKAFEEGKVSLEALRDFAVANGEPAVVSGKQEYLENLINRFI